MFPLFDSIVYATAQAVDGEVWTPDDDFDRGIAQRRILPQVSRQVAIVSSVG